MLETLSVEGTCGCLLAVVSFTIDIILIKRYEVLGIFR